MPPRRKNTSGSSGKLKQKTLEGFVAHNDAAEPSTPIPQGAGQKRRRVASSQRASQRVGGGEDEDVSSDEVVETIHFEPRRVGISDDEDNQGSSPRRPKRAKISAAVGSRRTSPSVDIEILSESDNSAKHRTAPARRKGKAAAQAPVRDEESEEEQPRRRRLRKGVRPPTPEEELMEEVNEDAIVDSRLRSRQKKTAFQKNLDRMKRKKRGIAASSSSSSEGSEEGNDDDNDAPFAGARPDASSDAEGDEDNDEQDGSDHEESWIVEDEGSVSEMLPTEFSMNTHQDLIHHFKIICQLFVHSAVRPAEERGAFMKQQIEENDYFKIPLVIARRKLSGLRDVSVASSVWRPAFRKSLLTYSEFSLTRLDFAVPQCDACHLGGRLSTFAGRVLGDRYDPFSYEPIGQTSDSEDSDEEKDDVHDSAWRRRSKSNIRAEYNLGRFCAARTQVFHNLSHWEYELFHSLLREVDDLRNRAEGGKPHFVRVAFSKGLQPPDDLTDADGIMDWLDERGVIGMEWNKIKQLMERARQLEAKAGKKEDEIDLDVS